MEQEQQRMLRENFLSPEVRDGVVVSAELKRLWKTLLDIFEEFVRICDRHGLRYCMDGGSLLGAVRHKGFIPWDDDMDVSLPREDFDRFLQVAPLELAEPYFLQYATTDPEHWKGFACLRRSDTTAIDPQWIRDGRRFNMGIGLDIFPIDRLTEARIDPIARKSWRYAWLLDHAHGRWRGHLRNTVANLVARTVSRCVGFERLVRWRDQNLASCGRGNCELCGNIAFNYGNRRAIWDAKVYEKRLRVPFEYLEVCIPVGYEDYLTHVYGRNWRMPVRGSGDHEVLDVSTDIPYKQVLVEKYGYSPKAVRNLVGPMGK